MRENKESIAKLSKLHYDVHNLTYDVELRVDELEKPKDGQVEKEAEDFDDFEEILEGDVEDDDSKLSANKITIKRVWKILHEIDDFFYDVNSSKRYPVEKKDKRKSVKVNASDMMPQIGHGHVQGHGRSGKSFTLGGPPSSNAQFKFSVEMEELCDPDDHKPPPVVESGFFGSAPGTIDSR